MPKAYVPLAECLPASVYANLAPCESNLRDMTTLRVPPCLKKDRYLDCPRLSPSEVEPTARTREVRNVE